MSTTSDAPKPKPTLSVGRPKITRWWKPEDGILDGHLIWQGDEPDRSTGETRRVFAIRESTTRLVFGLVDRAGLWNLRLAKPGSRVCIRPRGEFDINAEARGSDHGNSP